MRIGKPKREGVKQVSQKCKAMMFGDRWHRGRLIARWRRQNGKKNEKNIKRREEKEKCKRCWL